MSSMIRNPYTGTMVDFDSLPTFSRERQQPGRFCPATGNPLDEVAFRNFSFCFGNDESNSRLRNLYLGHVNTIRKSLGQEPISLVAAIKAAPLSASEMQEIKDHITATIRALGPSAVSTLTPPSGNSGETLSPITPGA